MFFDLDEVYKEPDLDHLCCIDISTAPRGWAKNESHFITFRFETDSSPLWCSQPVEGKGLSFKEWASPNSKISPKKISAEEVLRLIETTYKEVRGGPVELEPPLLKYQVKVSTRALPESLTIIEFVEKTTSRDKPERVIELDDEP